MSTIHLYLPVALSHTNLGYYIRWYGSSCAINPKVSRETINHSSKSYHTTDISI